MSHPTRSIIALFAASGLALAGCQAIPATSLPALSRVDPLALQAHAVEAVVVHPSALVFGDGSAVLSLDAADPGRGVEGRETFHLVVETGDGPVRGVKRPDGTVLTRLQVAPADRARFDAFMATVRAYRDAPRAKGAPQGRFSIGLNSTPCRNDGRTDPLPVAAYIKTDAGDRFHPVARDVDASADGAVPACGATGPAG